MAEKSLKTKPAEEAAKPEAAEPVVTRARKQEEPGYRVYIGPTIRGRIQYGAVFASVQEARQVLAAELEVCPVLAGLLVSGAELPQARLDVKKPGTARYVQAAQVRAALINP